MAKIALGVSRGQRETTWKASASLWWLLFPLAVLVGAGWAGVKTWLTYDALSRKTETYQQLETEIEALRTANRKLRLLEAELLDLRELQQQMLRLAGIERGLGVDLQLLEALREASMDTTSGSGELLLWPVIGEPLPGAAAGGTLTSTGPGLDLAAESGATVVVSGAGVVIGSETEPPREIVIDHGNGTTTLYRNLSVLLVDVGDSLSAGQIIGLVDKVEEDRPPHLHFEVRLDGQLVSPQEFIIQETPWDRTRESATPIHQ